MEVKPKSKGFQVKEGSAELVDTAQKEDVALFLHTSGTTSRPKVSSCSALKHMLAFLLSCHILDAQHLLCHDAEISTAAYN